MHYKVCDVALMHYKVCPAEIRRRVVEVYGEVAWMERMWRNGVCCPKMVWLTCMKNNEVDAIFFCHGKFGRNGQCRTWGKQAIHNFWITRNFFQLCFAVRSRKLLQNICTQETPLNLRPSIHNRRRGLLTRALCLLRDDARRNADPSTRALAEYFKRQHFENPPYSPDLASNDYRFNM